MSGAWRNLYVITGKTPQSSLPLNTLPDKMAGDWIVISRELTQFSWAKSAIMPEQAKQLLGQEFKHAIFDARQGLNLDALAIVTGTLVQGSLLLLLLTDRSNDWQDLDSLRWNESDIPITTPNFMAHLWQTIEYHQSENICCHSFDPNENLVDWIVTHYQNANRHLDDVKTDKLCTEPYAQQSQALQQLQQTDAEIVMLTAKRGRGKSALAGMFTHYHQCWITAPNQLAITALTRFAVSPIVFIAPDELIKRLQHDPMRPEWIIIDEAAMIPLILLEQIIALSPRVLLTSTIDGYEGTGQGLLLKLFKKISSTRTSQAMTLATPIRWQIDDPLEAFIDQLLLTHVSNEQKNIPIAHTPLTICHHTKDDKLSAMTLAKTSLLAEVFQLLKQAHYRTSLTDLRRLFDANNIELFTASSAALVGSVIAVREGELDETLIKQIKNGVRRPRGNLVAQSLVAHGGEQLAAKLKSLRINRIAVAEYYRRQGIGSQLLHYVREYGKQQQYDYLSVSFSYSPDMYQFWLQQQFKLVHIGTHKETSSGSYAAMAIYPLSEAGQQLCQKMTATLARNWLCYQYYIDIDLAITIDSDLVLTEHDWQILQSFAHFYYAYEGALPALYRLAKGHIAHLEKGDTLYPILSLLQNEGQQEYAIIQQLTLSGRRQFVTLLRQEVKQYLANW